MFRDIEILPPAAGVGPDAGAQDFVRRGRSPPARACGWTQTRGKAWRPSVVVDDDTAPRFEFQAATEGEAPGAGLDRDGVLSERWFRQLAGSKAFGHDDPVGEYDIDEGWKAYEIRLADKAAGRFDRIVPGADADAEDVEGDACFRNVTREGAGAANLTVELR